jgi:SAM-dependent methyltransferase
MMTRFWPGRRQQFGEGDAPSPAIEAGSDSSAPVNGPGDGFTAHNIRLDDGSFTLPREGLLADGPWCLATKRLLRTVYPDGVAGKRIADLGCLEGGYAVEFARMGMDTLGLEVRQSNFEHCLQVKSRLNLPNLNFVRDDAWNIAEQGHFDVIFCCGLLYHFDKPCEYIKLLSAICRKMVILNTHFSSDLENPHFNLGPLCENEGVPGRWYGEYPPGEEVDLERLKWTSWSNSDSFWIKHEYIPQVLREAGFDLVFEQLDFLPDPISAGLVPERDRGMFVGIKTGTT